MNISIILAHPNKASFTHAIASRAREVLERHGHAVCFHDLYEEQFNPILPYAEFAENEGGLLINIQRYREEIVSADGIIVVHPNWSGQPPSILKAWVDCVLWPGVVRHYQGGDDGEGIPMGLLRAQAALLFNTSNTGAAKEKKVFKDPLETLWKHCIFGRCGVRFVHREMFNGIVTSRSEERQAWLSRVECTIQNIFQRPQRSVPVRRAQRNQKKNVLQKPGAENNPMEDAHTFIR